MDQVEQTKPQSRLGSSVDLENVVAMDENQPLPSVRDVPGGTISFLFEKISTSLDNVGDGTSQPV